MSDGKFTKIAVGLLTNARDLVDWGITGGHTTAEQLRLTVSARKEAVAKLRKQGLSHRQIAAAVGADKHTVARDLAGADAPESGANAPFSKCDSIRERNAKLAETSVEVPRDKFETIVLDPPWPMTKIERDVRKGS